MCALPYAHVPPDAGCVLCGTRLGSPPSEGRHEAPCVPEVGLLSALAVVSAPDGDGAAPAGNPAEEDGVVMAL